MCTQIQYNSYRERKNNEVPGYWHRSIGVIKRHNMAIDTDVYTCPENASSIRSAPSIVF